MTLWSQFFGRDPKELFLAFSPHKASWRVVSWNFDIKTHDTRQWVIETSGQDKTSIVWRRAGHENLMFHKNDKIVRKKSISAEDSELRVLMNLAIHSSIKFSLEKNHEFMVTPVIGATAIDMQNETRALQWIQASFGTLTRALDRIEEDPLLILTAAFFEGIEPESGEQVLRVVAMNLDIFFYLKPDHTLQIAIFDDKGMGHGTSKTPTFQQIIKVTKPQFYDEIVRLINRLAIVGEVK